MYASAAQMVSRFTEREVVALTDRSGAGLVDALHLGQALQGASDEIDVYLARRYTLPLAVGGTPMATPPAVLVGLCCDIARYRLAGTEVQETEAIRQRYKDAIALLKLLASGETAFAEGPDVTSTAPSTIGPGFSEANQRSRVFGADTLGTY